MADENSNPAEEKMKEDCKEQMYKAAVIYNNFMNSDIDKVVEKNNVYMISSDFTENFKNKIKYEENMDLFNEDSPENIKKFTEQFKNYSLTDLVEIIFKDIRFFGDLDQIKEEDAKQGFDFITKDFLDVLEYDINNGKDNENKDNIQDDYKIKYIKNGNNIIIIFNDESKLLAITLNNKTKYHAIPPPITTKPNKTLKRRNSVCVPSRKKKSLSQLILSNKKKVK